MKINPYSWHSRLYQEGLEMCAKFTGRAHLEYKYRQRTNLCHYMRVPIVYVPLITLAHLGTISLALAAIAYVPVSLWGTWSYLKILLLGVLCLGAMTGLGALGLFLADKISDWKDNREVARYIRENRIEVEPMEPKPFKHTWLSLVFDYFWAKKMKVCPMIEFNEEEEEWDAE